MIQGIEWIFACTAQQSESEDDLLDEGDDDIEDEYDHELNVPVSTEPVPKERPQPLVSKETERQLSKKELKKKELAELEAVLAELGIPKKETNGQDDSHGNFFSRIFFLFIIFSFGQEKKGSFFSTSNWYENMTELKSSSFRFLSSSIQFSIFHG